MDALLFQAFLNFRKVAAFNVSFVLLVGAASGRSKWKIKMFCHKPTQAILFTINVTTSTRSRCPLKCAFFQGYSIYRFKIQPLLRIQSRFKNTACCTQSVITCFINTAVICLQSINETGLILVCIVNRTLT